MASHVMCHMGQRSAEIHVMCGEVKTQKDYYARLKEICGKCKDCEAAVFEYFCHTYLQGGKDAVLAQSKMFGKEFL